MRSTEDYLDKAAHFRDLAARASEPSLRIRYADLADCYRMLGEERKRLIAEGVITPDAA